MAYPTPTAGQYNSPVFQQFLARHPAFATASATKAGLNQFLGAHPDIADAYARLLAPPKAAAAPAASAPDAAAAADTATQSATAFIDTWLQARGLNGIGKAAWQRYLELGGDSNENAMDVIYQELKSNAPWTNGAYANRYPGIPAGMDEAQYRGLEDQYKTRAKQYGLPTSFFDDPTDFGKLISGNVSPDEYEHRLQMAARYSATDPGAARLRDEYARLYGPQLGQGAATAYMIDPTKALDVLERQHQSATIAAASLGTGFGSLTRAQAESVAATGVSESDATSALSDLADLRPLETALVGDAGSQVISQDDLLNAKFAGDSGARKRVKSETQRRLATFQGGGGYAAGSGGISGLGSAD